MHLCLEIIEGATDHVAINRKGTISPCRSLADDGLEAAAIAAAPQASNEAAHAVVRPAQYSSGKRLSEEARYCLERRQLEKEVRSHSHHNHHNHHRIARRLKQ